MRKILVNTGSNIAVVMVKLVITFIMTPVFVHNLGNHDYGVWEIMAALIGYMGLLDMGMKPAISRFAARHLASDDHRSLQVLYSSAFFFLLLVGVILFAVFAAWALFWPQLIAEQGSEAGKYAIFLAVLGAQLLVVFPGYTAESFLEGFQKYYLKNNITIVNSIIGAVILYLFIEPGNALVLLAAVNAIGLSVKYVIYTWLLSRQDFGGFRPRVSAASFSELKTTIRFGAKSLVQGIASTVETRTDSIIIGVFLGPAMVPFYAIPANLISYVRNIGWTLTHAFMPVFSDMHARQQKQAMQALYLNASRYVVALLLPTCVGIVLIGADFIAVWVGEAYRRDADMIILLLVLYMALPFLNPFSTRYLTAIDQHGLLARVYPMSAAINLVASILLVQHWGIVGVALGSVIPVFLLVPIVLRACCRHLDMTVGHYLRHSVWPALLPSALMAAAVHGFTRFYVPDSYAMLAAAALVGAAVYSLVFYWLGLNPQERGWLHARLGKLARRS